MGHTIFHDTRNAAGHSFRRNQLTRINITSAIGKCCCGDGTNRQHSPVETLLLPTSSSAPTVLHRTHACTLVYMNRRDPKHDDRNKTFETQDTEKVHPRTWEEMGIQIPHIFLKLRGAMVCPFCRHTLLSVLARFVLLRSLFTIKSIAQ